MPSTPKRKATAATESPRSSKKLRASDSVVAEHETAHVSSKRKSAGRTAPSKPKSAERTTPSKPESAGKITPSKGKSAERTTPLKPKSSDETSLKPKLERTSLTPKPESDVPAEDTESKIKTKTKKSRPRALKEHAASKTSEVVARSKANLKPVKLEVAIPETIPVEITKPEAKRPRKPRLTKEEKEAANMPLAPRTPNLRMFIGAHVSAAKGVQNAIGNATHIGGNALALFLKSQRKWANPPLPDEHCQLFHARCAEHGFDASQHVLPHGSYLVNLAQADPAKAKQAYEVFLDDLQRCERLGIRLYNFHPGNTNSHPRSEAIGRIADAINRAHQATTHVKPVLENMAGAGNVIGAAFEDLRDIIALVDDKARIGVCLDTCHAFAAGYDLRSAAAFRATLSAFDTTVGAPFLSALHLNDSKAPLASHRDLHHNIGLGFLGLRAFHHIMNEPRFEALPLVLETPIEVRRPDGSVVEDRAVWAREIKLLESLIGMDPDSAQFTALEADLAAQGAAERAKFQDQADRKRAKEQRSKARKTSQQRKEETDDEDDDDKDNDSND